VSHKVCLRQLHHRRLHHGCRVDRDGRRAPLGGLMMRLGWLLVLVLVLVGILRELAGQGCRIVKRRVLFRRNKERARVAGRRQLQRVRS